MRVQMIHLQFIQLFKNKKLEWWKNREDKLLQEFSSREEDLRTNLNQKITQILNELGTKQKDLEHKQLDLEDLEKRVSDRKTELERTNQELKEQIRLIEAKAKPDSVWISAFTSGFNRAWEVMKPILDQAVQEAHKMIKSQEIDESLRRIEPIIEGRINKLKSTPIKTIAMIEAKRNEILMKRANSGTPEEKSKRDNYLEVINWILSESNGNKIHKT